MNDYYYGEGADKHESPTRRLMDHKKMQLEHKKTMKDGIDKGDYSLTYCPSPKKSYVIEPQGGTLNYGIVKKDPLKFYD